MSIKAFALARIGRDAEPRTLQDGTPVLNLSLAVTRRAKGEKLTDWIEGSMFGQRVNALSPYLKKGGLVAVALSDLHIETYTGKNGEGHKLVARIEDVELAGSGERQQDAPRPAPVRAAQQPPAAIDDDIPF